MCYYIAFYSIYMQGKSCKNVHGLSASDTYDRQRKTSSNPVLEDVVEPAGYVGF